MLKFKTKQDLELWQKVFVVCVQQDASVSQAAKNADYAVELFRERADEAPHEIYLADA